MKILHAASECFPLAKTGGLGDVVAALPAALNRVGMDARVCLPAYRGTTAQLTDVRLSNVRFDIRGYRFNVVEGRLADSGLHLVLLDCPLLFDRPGDPYHDDKGVPWHDNAWRFGCFSAAVTQLAAGWDGWRPDIVHLHDWQLGLAAPHLMRAGSQRPAVVFTIHNLAYQGIFGRDQFEALDLPRVWWHVDGVEFWGGLSFMKAGLNYSDAITTVSPTYAREIREPAFGHGLDGVLRAREGVLCGIANGIDVDVWNPATDPHLQQHYSERDRATGKRANKIALQQELGLPVGDTPLLIFIGRFAEQKGADLLIAASSALAGDQLQIAVLGSGDRALERAFAEWAAREPGRVAVRLLHDERLAHRLTASADLQLMPSRFEPCGLNQMYAQRYGTLPIVRYTGGLADTVVDATEATINDGTATGIHFEHSDVGGVIHGVRRGLELFAQEKIRTAMQRTGMARDFSWTHAAQKYVDLYRRLRRR